MSGRGESVNTKRMPRWPLAVIAAPAAVAVWSGWVGLGGMCGFGIIHPLPGIWDAAHLNTAITLPIGVEAYGAYALGAWLTPGTSERARRFAKRSAIGALGLGMAGQVIYHLLAAAHATRAPWPVVMLVSCLPVVALALGTALAHLLRDAAGDVPAQVTIPAPETAGQTVADVPADVSGVAGVDVPASTAPTVPVSVPEDSGRTVAANRVPRRANGRTPKRPERVFSAELERGELPSLRTVKTKMNVGTDKARDILADLQEAVAGQGVTVDA